jgi:DNA replication protein DnaC
MTSLRDALNAVLKASDKVIDFEQAAATVGQSPPAREVECTICNGAGFVVNGAYDPNTMHYSETTVRCPDPDCPVVKRNLKARYDTLIAKAPLPAEYANFDFQDWYRLSERQPDMCRGKWLGIGVAMVFAHNAEVGHWFRLQEAYAMVDVDQPAPNEFSKNSLVLAGKPGVGKTSLAACIVNDLRTKEIPALYERVSNILDALKEPFNHGNDREYDYGETEQKILNTFKQAPVLVMDEFNLARASDYSRQRLEDIVRHRYAHQLPTVMTTNLTSFDEFNEHWGDRVGHAVEGMAHWIVMSGAELRRRGGPVESV